MPTYSGWANSWFGQQDVNKPATGDYTLWLTDGTTTVEFAMFDELYGVARQVPAPASIPSGWGLIGPDPWQMRTADLKGGGFKSNPATAHGQFLRQAVFDVVTEALTAHLRFYSADGLLGELGRAESLLKVKAVDYWTERRNHTPVYLKRQLPGETQVSYALVSHGSALASSSIWSAQCTMDTGYMRPILLTVVRQPFWLGAVPGEVQKNLNVSVLQDWEYNLAWAAETTDPAGYVYCFVENRTGDIWAGCASEIWKWNGEVWAAETVTPLTLTDDITSSVLMANGDILFGGNSRIIRRNSAGTWEVETFLPTGQVWDMILTATGLVYAADNGRILKRGTDGVWSVDSTLPAGQVYSFTEYRTGRVFAGATNEILKTADPVVPPEEIAIAVVAANDEAEQFGTYVYTNPVARDDIDLFDRGWVALRFKVDIASGAVINEAKVRFTATHDMPACYNTPMNTESCRIYCEDIDSSAAFSRTTNGISSKTLTTAYEPWSVTVLWRGEYTYLTPDIRSVIQEVIDRPGWVSGNYITVIFRSDNLTFQEQWTRREAYSYTGSPDRAPRLVITYTGVPTTDTNWVRCTSDVTGNIRSMLSPSCAPLILAGDNGVIRGSDDEGLTWGAISSLPGAEVTSLYHFGDYVYAGSNGEILRSPDCGRNWTQQSTTPAGYVHAFIDESVTGDLRAGDNAQILILDTSSLVVTLGHSGEDAAGTIKLDEVFVANHHKTCNLTNIHIVDGGWVGGNIFPITSYSTALLPASPAVDDAIYFGVDTTVDDTGPFGNLIFDIDQIAFSTGGSYTIVWEYYNGAAWTTLTCTDETSQFSEPGVNGVFWEHPSDWSTVAVGGTTGYWVRARVSALVGTLYPPTQQNRSVYSSISNFVTVDSQALRGNIESLMRLYAHQRADTGGVSGSAPNLYANRVWVSAKEYAGNENFRAFLNFADEQNPEGVTVNVSVDSDSATSIEADSNLSSATGRRVFFDAGTGGLALNTFRDRVAFEIDIELANQFYGTYLPILRCKQNGGSAGEVSFRIKVVSGTGGISKVGDTKVTQSTTDNELIVFDEPITLPVSSQMKEDDIGDVTSIIVQIAAEQTDADAYLYDLFLHSTDVPWLDLMDTANTANSVLENGHRLMMDSIGIPKSPTRAIVQEMATDAFVSSWRVNGNGDARLQTGTSLRLWFLQAHTNGAASTLWLSKPEQCMSIVVQATDRWLLGRGAT